jgi:hypothetical protein
VNKRHFESLSDLLLFSVSLFMVKFLAHEIFSSGPEALEGKRAKNVKE